MSQSDTVRPPRPFKSAEKPVSLHPLSFKQAVIALLQVGPIDRDEDPRSEPAKTP